MNNNALKVHDMNRLAVACMSMCLVAGAPAVEAATVTTVNMDCARGGAYFYCGSLIQGAPLKDTVVGTFSEPAGYVRESVSTDIRNRSIYWSSQGSYAAYAFDLSASADNSDAQTVGRVDGIGASGSLSVTGLELSYSGTGSPVSAPVTMNIRVAGSSAVASNTFPGSAGSNLAYAGANLGFYMQLYDIKPGGNYGETAYRDSLSTDVSGLGLQIANGAYNSSFNTIVSISTEIPLGSFGAGYGFTASASVGGSDAWRGAWPVASMDLNGLGWVPGMQVFNTPEGFSVNSSDGLIVDNVFMPAVVPVPAAVWLFASGLLGIVSMARRRKPHAAIPWIWDGSKAANRG